MTVGGAESQLTDNQVLPQKQFWNLRLSQAWQSLLGRILKILRRQQWNCGTGSAFPGIEHNPECQINTLLCHIIWTVQWVLTRRVAPLYSFMGGLVTCSLITNPFYGIPSSIFFQLKSSWQLCFILTIAGTTKCSCSRGIKDQKRCAWRHSRTEKVCFRKCQYTFAYYSTSAPTNCVRSQIFMEH